MTAWAGGVGRSVISGDRVSARLSLPGTLSHNEQVDMLETLRDAQSPVTAQ